MTQATEKTIFYTITTILVAGMAILFIFITSSSVAKDAQIPQDLKKNIIINRFLSSDCFTVKDDKSSITTNYIIDWNKFTQENLDHCYNINIEDIQNKVFRLSIKHNNEERYLRSKNWGEKFGVKKDVFTILLYDQGNYYKEDLSIEYD